jgi:hypothetical protein
MGSFPEKIASCERIYNRPKTPHICYSAITLSNKFKATAQQSQHTHAKYLAIQ